MKSNKDYCKDNYSNCTHLSNQLVFSLAYNSPKAEQAQTSLEKIVHVRGNLFQLSKTSFGFNLKGVAGTIISSYISPTNNYSEYKSKEPQYWILHS